MEKFKEIIVENLFDDLLERNNNVIFNNNFEMNIFNLTKYVKLVFLDTNVKEDNVDFVLEDISSYVESIKLKVFNSYIIVAKTFEEFDQKDLFYVYGDKAYAILLLYNEHTKEIYYYDYWVCPIYVNFKKFVRKIKLIIEENIK